MLSEGYFFDVIYSFENLEEGNHWYKNVELRNYADSLIFNANLAGSRKNEERSISNFHFEAYFGSYFFQTARKAYDQMKKW